MNPWPSLYALPLRRRPGVFVPTMVARLFSSAKAETISPALAVCSFTNSTTRPWKRRWPSPSVTTRIDFSTKAYRAASHMRVAGATIQFNGGFHAKTLFRGKEPAAVMREPVLGEHFERPQQVTTTHGIERILLLRHADSMPHRCEKRKAHPGQQFTMIRLGRPVGFQQLPPLGFHSTLKTTRIASCEIEKRVAKKCGEFEIESLCNGGSLCGPCRMQKTLSASRTKGPIAPVRLRKAAPFLNIRFDS